MYIGLDLGTSGLKAVLMDERQVLIGEANASLTVSRPRDGWSEQDPDHWIRAAAEALASLAAAHPLDAVRGIGLSGQMHGATLLDASDTPLRPCILWNDTRASAEAAVMDADPKFRAITGNIVFPGFTAPKLAWVKAHEPKVFERTRKVLLPKDYLRLWLTGDHVAEMSDAAGTSWLDTGARAWSDDLLSATSLSRDAMPSLVEGSDKSGKLRPGLAERFGLPSGIPVAGGAGDNAATAIGLGVVNAGNAFLSLGTSGVLFAASDVYAPDPETAVHTFCHALPDTWHQMGVILAATDALAWLGRLLSHEPSALTALLGDKLEAPGRELFLPYLGGERTPHNDATIRGGFIGLAHATDQKAGARAVMEGVAYAFRDCRDALAATGTGLDSLIAAGGGSNSAAWLKMLATVLNTPIAVPKHGGLGAAFGAARLGFMAAEGANSGIATAPEISATLEPDKTLTRAFDEGHLRYKAAYNALKEIP